MALLSSLVPYSLELLALRRLPASAFSAALNDGPWTVDVYVGRKRVDHKEQTYQPHGSISPADLPAQALVHIEAWHMDLKGTEHVFVPNGCTVP